MTHDNTAIVERRRLLAQVHLGGKRLFGDDRETYEEYLHTHTGERSCAALTVPQLRAVALELRRAGALDGPARGGQRAADRPTPAQWAKLGALARAMGWEGLESPALQGFVKRTAKVSHSRFLTRAQASRVITGLETWLGQKNSGAGASRPLGPFGSAQDGPGRPGSQPAADAPG